MDLSPCTEDIDVAVQMGFGSFGAQSTTKKRKYNPTADTFTTDKAELSKRILPLDNRRLHEDYGRDGHPRSSSAIQARGANQTTLSAGRTQGELFSAGNTANATSSRRAMSMQEEQREKDYEEPSYVEDSPPASPSPKAAMPGLMNTAFFTKKSSPRDEERSVLEHPHPDPVPDMNKLKPTGPSPEEILPSENKESKLWDQHYDWAALRRGVRDARGDVAYYDKSFIEDPWQELRSRLEKERRHL